MKVFRAWGFESSFWKGAFKNSYYKSWRTNYFCFHPRSSLFLLFALMGSCNTLIEKAVQTEFTTVSCQEVLYFAPLQLMIMRQATQQQWKLKFVLRKEQVRIMSCVTGYQILSFMWAETVDSLTSILPHLLHCLCNFNWIISIYSSLHFDRPFLSM